MFKYIRTCMMLSLLPLAFSACKHDELAVPGEKESFRLAGDFIRNNYDLSLFNAAMEYTGLAEEMNGPGPYTLLVPGNTAFNELGITRPSDFQKLNKDSLKAALQYHILSRRLPSSAIPANGVDIRYTNLANKEVYLTYAAFPVDYPQFPTNHIYVNGSFVTKKDVVLANGILYVLDKVIKYNPGTVQDWLAARPEYSVFVAALKQFGLWNQLSGEGPFTVLAPDNEALAKAGITMESLQLYTPERYLGARLFGVYLLRKRHFFLTDFPAFSSMYGASGTQAAIEGDSYEYTMSATKNTYQVSPTVYTFGYQDPARPFLGVLRSVTGNTSRRNDNLTDNGVVHYLPGVVVMPEEALKK
ncbi:Fasciclin domain-containing protein [Chitinophaga terrae (ex Kim and Jung 2007)]|uniref:Fasciclin domain-containing protein n=1 Tax=Chitinophaga terrae (ex Kim and Jung 2007) TaxID=408074 RepID=A0A1H4EII0_9BACT|nr:fasciclin domain-containing protein [Chitinophaga terrae (ex Kim and Jung 2007)]SEA84508.1 Fasciclin domain-containing protein [Chitinophaga terrae (ex Kim and Jung 2007)]